MSITPRTDAAVAGMQFSNAPHDLDGKFADFARELECENARLRETLEAALQAAELDYKSAVLDYEKAQEEGVSYFHEHNMASYQKGIRDALRNLLATIDAAMEETK